MKYLLWKYFRKCTVDKEDYIDEYIIFYLFKSIY